jgi:predicted methyltransferase
MKSTLWALALMSWLGQTDALSAEPAKVPPVVATALADPARPDADKQRDVARKPGELIAFAGIKPGDKVADFIPGSGYFTRIFSKIVGPSGKVYAIIPDGFAKAFPKGVDAMTHLTADPAYANVKMLIEPLDQTGAPEPLDMVWTSDNYHDLYGQAGADAAAQADKAIFKALKPGGVFMVIDHAAADGADGNDAKTLHRIERSTVERQVTAAGFVLDAESALLHNPGDLHTEAVFAPDIRGHTDQFVLKFRKPNG